MKWTINFHPKFEPEFNDLDLEVQDELYANLILLENFGPQLGRPNVDTLKGICYDYYVKK